MAHAQDRVGWRGSTAQATPHGPASQVGESTPSTQSFTEEEGTSQEARRAKVRLFMCRGKAPADAPRVRDGHRHRRADTRLSRPKSAQEGQGRSRRASIGSQEQSGNSSASESDASAVSGASGSLADKASSEPMGFGFAGVFLPRVGARGSVGVGLRQGLKAPVRRDIVVDLDKLESDVDGARSDPDVGATGRSWARLHAAAAQAATSRRAHSDTELEVTTSVHAWGAKHVGASGHKVRKCFTATSSQLDRVLTVAPCDGNHSCCNSTRTFRGKRSQPGSTQALAQVHGLC